MNTFRVKLKSKKEIAENTLLLELEKPANFEFKAGQFVMMIIPTLKNDVEGGNQRAMSIASPPYFENLQIVFRKGESQFKKAAENLAIDQEIEIKGPYGVFTLSEKEKIKEIVFLVGGVGITSARSILLEAIKKKLPIIFFLFYSNLRPETAAFLEELEKLENQNFRLICTMTEVDEAVALSSPFANARVMKKSQEEWKGEIGFINLEMLKKYISDIKKPLYCVVGPPVFVEAMKKMLQEAGVEDKKIKLEKF